MNPTDDSISIDLLGGTAAVARMCNVKQPSVSEWRVKGIPAARRQFLQLLRPGAFDPRAISDSRRATAANETDGEAAETDGNPVPNLSDAA